MEEGCLLLLRVDDGSRRRGILMDRAGPKARVLSEHDGVDDFLARLAGFDVTEVVRSETLRVATGANRDLEVVS